MVEGECIHIGNLIPKTALLSQKEALRESNFKRYGRRRMYTHRNLISKTAISSQKAALRESNFKKYGRRRVYTHRFDSQNGHFEPESSFTGIKFQELEGECIHIGNLIPKTAISSQKAALRESNFKN